MKKISPDRIRLSAAEARALAEASLSGIGYDAGQARIIADHVIDAALCGYEYSGLPKILNIPEYPRAKWPRKKLRVVRETEVSALIDGGNNVGMLALYQAAQIAIDKAHARGFALVGAYNTWMTGRSAYYVEMITRADLVGIHTVAAFPAVAPLGGTRAVLGTNPIAVGLPTAGDPVILDMGTSAYMMTELRLRERLGELLPEGVAIDSEGRPTRDPAQARLGALLTFGGHKGYGLAFIMQALGIVAGSAHDPGKEFGFLLIVFKPDLLVPLAEFKRQVSELVARVQATPRQPGVDEIRIPSQRAFRERARAGADGIDIDRQVYDALITLPQRCAMPAYE
jgi:LDH2 family malate/lactate/ureidoglycolate dehydrogenase